MTLKILTGFRKVTLRENIGLADLPGFANIQQKNRTIINKVEQWITKEELENSYFGYGIPDEILPLINLPLNKEIIYTDLIMAAAEKLATLRYLEIGVSVGKNFLPVTCGLQDAECMAWDIENPPPVLLQTFQHWKLSKERPSHPTSVRKEPARLWKWEWNGMPGKYLSADVLDEANWQQLEGQKFNLVFSDALHDPQAIIFEFNMLEKYHLLKKDFIIFYDDLHANMQPAFIEICKKVQDKRALKKIYTYLVKTNGWLGQNYPHKHPIGIISTIDLG